MVWFMAGIALGMLVRVFWQQHRHDDGGLAGAFLLGCLSFIALSTEAAPLTAVAQVLIGGVVALSVMAWFTWAGDAHAQNVMLRGVGVILVAAVGLVAALEAAGIHLLDGLSKFSAGPVALEFRGSNPKGAPEFPLPVGSERSEPSSQRVDEAITLLNALVSGERRDQRLYGLQPNTLPRRPDSGKTFMELVVQPLSERMTLVHAVKQDVGASLITGERFSAKAVIETLRRLVHASLADGVPASHLAGMIEEAIKHDRLVRDLRDHMDMFSKYVDVEAARVCREQRSVLEAMELVKPSKDCLESPSASKLGDEVWGKLTLEEVRNRPYMTLVLATLLYAIEERDAAAVILDLWLTRNAAPDVAASQPLEQRAAGLETRFHRMRVTYWQARVQSVVDDPRRLRVAVHYFGLLVRDIDRIVDYDQDLRAAFDTVVLKPGEDQLRRWQPESIEQWNARRIWLCASDRQDQQRLLLVRLIYANNVLFYLSLLPDTLFDGRQTRPDLFAIVERWSKELLDADLRCLTDEHREQALNFRDSIGRFYLSLAAAASTAGDRELGLQYLCKASKAVGTGPLAHATSVPGEKDGYRVVRDKLNARDFAQSFSALRGDIANRVAAAGVGACRRSG